MMQNGDLRHKKQEVEPYKSLFLTCQGKMRE